MNLLREFIAEVTANQLQQIKSKTRTHMVPGGPHANSAVVLKDTQQKPGRKPIGFWYSIGTEWIDFVKHELDVYLPPGREKRETDLLYTLKLNRRKMLKISSSKELIKFSYEYGIITNYEDENTGKKYQSIYQIDWPKVAEKYNGIEISPYQHSMTFGSATEWYYGWDVASGCIWRVEGVKLKKIDPNARKSFKLKKKV